MKWGLVQKIRLDLAGDRPPQCFDWWVGGSSAFRNRVSRRDCDDLGSGGFCDLPKIFFEVVRW